MKTKVMAALLLVLSGYALGHVSSPVAVVSAAQPAPGHVYEMRTYTAAEGKLANVNARFRDHTQRIFAKHNMKSIGYWTPYRLMNDTTRGRVTLMSGSFSNISPTISRPRDR